MVGKVAGDALGGMGKTWPLCDPYSLSPVVRSIDGLKKEEHDRLPLLPGSGLES